jgi:beta-galactosidase
MQRHSNCLTAIFLGMALIAGIPSAVADAPVFTPPDSPRVTYSFNPGWKFIKQDVPGSDAPGFDDSKWDDVSTPHTYNDVDSFRNIITHGSGDTGTYHGPAWYRKHFKLPASAKDGKVFLEFEGIRQAANFFVNGKPAGLFENGVTACGLDITALVNFGPDDNVIAVRTDNSKGYQEQATKTGYEWDANDFNPSYGGLNTTSVLHLTGKVYQTLAALRKSPDHGRYIYPQNFSIGDKRAIVTSSREVKNETSDHQDVTLSVGRG